MLTTLHTVHQKTPFKRGYIMKQGKRLFFFFVFAKMSASKMQ